MRQAIQTKYLGPTNSKGDRILASSKAQSITKSWDHALTVDANHIEAAMSLAKKLKWTGEWCGGGTEASGYVFVNTTDGADFSVGEPTR
jgi:hypothetical protein